jgi:hypothetical protein
VAAEDLCTLDEYKAARGLVDSLDDGQIPRLITTASRWLAAECGRQFHRDSTATARKYPPPRRNDRLLVDDFSTLTGLVVVDDGATLTIDVDFIALPQDGRTAWGESGAWYMLLRYDGLWWSEPLRGNSVSVTARWGWPAVPEPVKQGVIEVVADLLKTKDNTFGFLNVIEGPTAVRLRANSHVAEVIAAYRRGDRASRLSGFA